jgi:hypothetical protein
MRAGTSLALAVLLGAAAARAEPASVTIAGSFQSELGCPGDWDPACALTQLAFDPSDGVWQATLSLPAGDHEYRAALNGSWDENYGSHGQQSGTNVVLSLATAGPVKFYYDDATHWVTDQVGSRIVTAPGSFQSELGCPGDWQPDCLRSWLEDVDGDGVYRLVTTDLPAGSYEVKAAVNESWDENYGSGGVPNGDQIQFLVPEHGRPVHFQFTGATNQLMVAVPVPEPAGAPATLAAFAALALCCARLDSRVNRLSADRSARADRRQEPPA